MSAWAALEQARSLIAVGRNGAAIEALAPAMADNATAPEAWCLQTQALLAEGDHQHALQSAKRAIELRPHDEWGHRLHALVLLGAGNKAGALSAAEEAVRLAPDQLECLHVLAICQIQMRSTRKQAVVTADMLLDRHPDSALAHYTAGAVHASLRKYPKALPLLREALRLDPQMSDAAALLADILKATGRPHEAGEMYLAAARASPTDSSIRRSLGRLGVPAIGISAWLILRATIVVSAARNATWMDPMAATAILAAFFVLVGGFFVYRRFTGTRTLPDDVHRALARDHRNYALGWLATAGVISIPLALWAAFAPPGDGRSFKLALGLVAFGLCTFVAFAVMWTGPYPKHVAVAARWLERLRASVMR
ncbi:tetratricopeptide repeat protein [Demequina maris]|uniref:tetratricopeptide repeat protein n=1 Tax=Demequina maris TaxID=1638982 RepID=UPI0007853554|nr:tetratricopeptide repeat protein [Demequina maris]